MDEITEDRLLALQKRREKFREFLQSINLCPLCSSPLSLIYEVDRDAGYIEELAHCGECQLETRKKDYPIQ